MHSMKLILVALLAIAVGWVTTGASAQTVNGNGTGTNNGFYYSLYSSGGSATMSLGSAGNYSINWSGVSDVVGGKGFNPGSAQVIGFNVASASGYNNISIYGWLTNPLVEYYITEFGQLYTADASQKGSLTSDGRNYTTYEHQQVNQPSIQGTATFEQYLDQGSGAVMGQNGVVTTSNHFNHWSSLGMSVGSFNYQILGTEAYNGASGSVNATVCAGSCGGGGGGGGGGTEGPYGGTAAAIPGTVMAENYDTGGQSVAYNVTSTNGTNNSYRSDGIDLEAATSPATSNDLGWTASGQWFKYTVNVATAGTYNVTFLVAGNSGANDAFHLSNSSGTNLTGSVAVPNTGGWQTWTTVTTSVTLPAGKQTLTLNEDNGGWNLDSMVFSSGGSVSCTTDPSAPTGLTATSGSSSAINLGWSAVTAPSNCTISAYKVFRSTTSGFTPSSSTQIASVSSGTAYSDTGLSASTTYYYLVEAVDAAGSSSASSQASAETGSTTGSGSFTLTPSSNSATVTQSGSTTDTITVGDVNGFSGSVSLSASGLPSGVTATFGSNPTTGSSVVTFSASSSAAPGASTVTITGTSGSLTANTTITLTVNQSTGGGGSACTVVYTVTSQWQGGYGASVSIANGGTTTLSNWTLTWTFANGQTISSSWNGNATQSGANVTVSEQSGQSWQNIPAGGSYTGFGFNGTWNNATNATPTNFALNGTPCNGGGGGSTGSFTLTPASSAVTLTQGTSTTDAISVADVNGFSGAVALSASSSNSGVTVAVSGDTLTLSASSSASGTATISVTGTSGSTTATTSITVTVQAGNTGSFTLTPASSAVTLTQGTSTTDAISVADVNGFSGAVTLSASSSNSGVTVAVSGDTLTLSASSSASGTATISVTGTSGSTTATTSITVTVNTSSGQSSCSPTDVMALDGGLYEFQMNEYDSTLQECATVSGTGFTLTTANFDNTTGGSPATYTSIYNGCHWGVCTSSSPFPIEENNIASATSSVSITQPSGYTDDASYDIWFNQTSTTTGQPNGTEIMIWLNNQGSVQPFGTNVGNVTIDGASWSVWTGNQTSWKIVSYEANTPVTSVNNLNLVPFFTDAVSRGSLEPTWWLIDVEYGFEIWTGGQGLAMSNFSVTATSGSSSTGSFTLTPSSNSATVTQSGNTTDTITVGDVNGFSGSVSLSASGLPSGVTATFGTNPTTGSSVVTFSAGSSAATGTSTVTIAGTSGSLTANTTIALTVNQSTGGGGGGGTVVHVANPYASATQYISPDWSNEVKAAAATESGTLASQMNVVATYPTAVWLDHIGAIYGGAANSSRMSLQQHITAALSQQSGSEPVVVTLVIYDLPDRDCAALASNGELSIAGGDTVVGSGGTSQTLTGTGLEEYENNYITPIYNILQPYASNANIRFVLVVEDDSLPNMVTNTGEGSNSAIANCVAANDGVTGSPSLNGVYVQAIQYALSTFHQLPNVYNYLDVGHHGWLGWSSNFTPAVNFLTSVAKGTTAGLASVDGFITNTANYGPTKEPYMTATEAVGSGEVYESTFYQYDPYIDEEDYAAALDAAFVQAGFPSTLGFLIDTSRNGWGSSSRPAGASSSTDLNTFVDASKIDLRDDMGQWCNQPNAGIGVPPTVNPGGFSNLSAYVWIKPPGESDGNYPGSVYNGVTSTTGDPNCNPTHDNALANSEPTNAMANSPKAGTFWIPYFTMLVQNAYPPIQ